MKPPLAMIAAKLQAAPSATIGIPVILRFASTARTTAAVDAA